MPELSPAAQTVLTAVTQSAYCLDPSDIPNEAARMASIAADALKAAADQADPERHVEDISYQHQMYVDGWKDCLEVIRNIANELKAQ